VANCELVHPDRQGRRASLSITPSPAAGQLSRRHRHHVGSPHSAGSQTCAVMPPPPFRAIRRPATLLQLLPPSSARSIEKREIAGCVTESSRLDMMVLLCCATQSYTHHGAYDYACRAVPGGGSQRRARRSCPIKGCGTYIPLSRRRKYVRERLPGYTPRAYRAGPTVRSPSMSRAGVGFGICRPIHNMMTRFSGCGYPIQDEVIGTGLQRETCAVPTSLPHYGFLTGNSNNLMRVGDPR